MSVFMSEYKEEKSDRNGGNIYCMMCTSVQYMCVHYYLFHIDE